MGAPKKLYWNLTDGGMGGPHHLLLADDAKYVGFFYKDASEGVDVEAVMRLIAAAPELLAALKEAERQLSLLYSGPNPDALLPIRAAISKAEGH